MTSCSTSLARERGGTSGRGALAIVTLGSAAAARPSIHRRSCASSRRTRASCRRPRGKGSSSTSSSTLPCTSPRHDSAHERGSCSRNSSPRRVRATGETRRRRRRRLRHANRATQARGQDDPLLPCRARPGAPQRHREPAPPEGAHLRERAWATARPRRRDVEHETRRARPHPGRADHALALARHLLGRGSPWPEAARERRVPTRKRASGRGGARCHVWFTGDLRSAFAIRAPEPEASARPASSRRSRCTSHG